MGRSRRRKYGSSQVHNNKMLFSRQNYRLLIASVLLLLVGFTAMRVENQVDGFLSLYVSPILLFVGYMGVIYAVMWRSSDKAEKNGG